MRMTNRLGKWSRFSTRVACLLSLCGLMYACKDEFVLDDEKPSWLESSIYESLEQQGNFRTYLRLLADKDVNPENVRPLTEVLDRTGSKTVMVANDSAWEKFFEANKRLPESNPWHYADCYEHLSAAQKKLLIHTSMLNNAIVMENLASSETDGTNAPTRGEYMRRLTDVQATDSITYVASENLPKNYAEKQTERDYWERFRAENGGNGIYMVTDSTLPMMIYFTAEHMGKNVIDSDVDFKRIMGRERKVSDVHIYDALLLDKDGVCENGYVNITEKPLCPLASMAEVIRINGKTNIFSHMLDRFSAPFYCNRITEAYAALHPDNHPDSIFNKRYFSDNSYTGANSRGALLYEPGPNGTLQKYQPYLNATSGDIVPKLKFDPGWNGYWDDSNPLNARKDMAAMYAPSDKALWDYFLDGGGADLINTYYRHEGEGDQNGEIYDADYQKPARGDFEALYKQIDCIPLATLDALINNIMCRSFVGSVPSKMGKLKNDVQEPLFYDADADREKIDTCLLASNGVVYVMDKTCPPADYRAVTAPAFISNTNKIMKFAIYDPKDKLHLNYYAYLKAMQSRFTLLMPCDTAFQHYYDPVSMKNKQPRVIVMKYKTGDYSAEGGYANYFGPYNETDATKWGTKGKIQMGASAKLSESDMTNRIKDILESHTIVHDGTNPMTFADTLNLKMSEDEKSRFDGSLDEWFLSKNGNAVKIIRDDKDSVIAVKGGFQIENERLISKGLDPSIVGPGVLECKLNKYRDMDNGYTFVLNAPLVPTYRSVYSILTDDDDKNQWSESEWEDIPYAKFYDLCRVNEDLIIGCGLVDNALKGTARTSALKKFQVFINDNGLDKNVRFFNNYRYTIFVPTNEVIEQQIAQYGLPTWEEIEQDYDAHRKPQKDEDGNIEYDEDGQIVYTDSLATAADSLRISAKITYLTNFVRYHFADNSVFADKSAMPHNEMVTASYDRDIGLFCKIHIDRVKNGSGTVLRVMDDVNYLSNGGMDGAVQPFVAENVNVLARDVSCSSDPVSKSMTGCQLQSSSAAVIHQIPGVLNHTKLENGRHDSMWSSSRQAKRYIQKYAIQ